MGDYIIPTGTTTELFIGGVPLSLYQYDEQIINPLNSNNETIYAIGVILKETISPINDKEYSYVWSGIRYIATQDYDGKYYFSSVIGEATSPIDMTIIGGVPIGIGEQRQLLFHNSELSIENIDEYFELSIGGCPLTVGRIGDKYYLVVYKINS